MYDDTSPPVESDPSAAARSGASATSGGGREYARMARALEWLSEHFERQPTLAEAAAVAGMSEFHFQRTFARWTGLSPKKYVQFLTLQRAKTLLEFEEIARFAYDHPVFDQASIDAQSRLRSVQGRNRAWFCGAWTGYGFHEDGLKSALRIAGDFGVQAPWEAVL